MRGPLVASCVVGVLLTALACGGGGGGHKSQLRNYLDRVDVEQGRYERTRSHVVRALAHASSRTADGTWVEAARELDRAEREFDHLAARMHAITPPAALRAVHAGMVRSLRLYRRLVDTIEAPLGHRDVVGVGRTVSTTTPLGTSANQLRSRWRMAAKAAAAEVGIEFPGRLNRVGTPLGN